MRICVIPRDEKIWAWLEGREKVENPHLFADPKLLEALRRQGFLTVGSRSLYTYSDAYGISFVEGQGRYPEEYFTPLPGQPALACFKSFEQELANLKSRQTGGWGPPIEDPSRGGGH